MTTSTRHTTPTEKAPEPLMGTELIPKERYISKEFMQLEWDHMWTKVWNMAGRESDTPNVGDYFTTELGTESLLIVREQPDQVRAFYNVCPHRGNQIRNAGMGHAESFQCAYHFFEFNLDGSRSSCLTKTPSPRACLRRRPSWKSPATRTAASSGST